MTDDIFIESQHRIFKGGKAPLGSLSPILKPALGIPQKTGPECQDAMDTF